MKLHDLYVERITNIKKKGSSELPDLVSTKPKQKHTLHAEDREYRWFIVIIKYLPRGTQKYSNICKGFLFLFSASAACWWDF